MANLIPEWRKVKSVSRFDGFTCLITGLGVGGFPLLVSDVVLRDFEVPLSLADTGDASF